MIPAFIFELGVWAAYAGVACGATYLLIVLVKEWKSGEIW